jgi:light-regulated signal transduction histidine kinase (bacteriophytochrome)
METADELQREDTDVRSGEGERVQAGVFLLELSPDWVVRRASENIAELLGHSAQRLIDQPLANFVNTQALHDLRNLFARLSGTMGIARAYGVRLTGSNGAADIAFQQVEGRVLLEAVPSAGTFGECFGTVAGLIDGLSKARGGALLDGAARRMRALTGYDRITLVCDGQTAVSSRGSFGAPAAMSDVLAMIIGDTAAGDVGIYPAKSSQTTVEHALMGSGDDQLLHRLRADGIRATLRVPFSDDGISGEFRCDSRSPRSPNFELHAAAELFAQLVSLRLQLDRLKN